MTFTGLNSQETTPQKGDNYKTIDPRASPILNQGKKSAIEIKTKQSLNQPKRATSTQRTPANNLDNSIMINDGLHNDSL